MFLRRLGLFNSGSGFGDGHSTAVGDTTLCLVGLMLISSLRTVYYNCEMGNVSRVVRLLLLNSHLSVSLYPVY